MYPHVLHMEVQNNKESFKLLGASESSSDSGSEIPQVILTPPQQRKRRLKRRVRNSSIPRHSNDSQPCQCYSRTIGLTVAVLALFCWLVTLTWLATMLHSELKRLDVNVQAVLPTIFPLSFSNKPSNSSDLIQVTCFVSKGDAPIDISWSFSGLQNDFKMLILSLAPETDVLKDT